MHESYVIYNGELYHYGVKGMKWGVRKNPAKAYSKALRKKSKLDKKLARTKDSLDDAKKTLDKSKERERQEQNELQYRRNELERASNNYRAAQIKQEKSRGNDPFRAHERAVQKTEKEYLKATKKYDEQVNKTNDAVSSRSWDESWVKSLSKKTEKLVSKSDKWQSAMNEVFSNVSEDKIAEGKALYEKQQRKRH